MRIPTTALPEFYCFHRCCIAGCNVHPCDASVTLRFMPTCNPYIFPFNRRIAGYCNLMSVLCAKTDQSALGAAPQVWSVAFPGDGDAADWVDAADNWLQTPSVVGLRAAAALMVMVCSLLLDPGQSARSTSTTFSPAWIAPLLSSRR